MFCFQHRKSCVAMGLIEVLIRYSSGTIVIAIRQKLRFRSRPKADWYFNHWSVFLVWSWSQSQGWIFCPKSKIFTYHRGQVLNFEQNIHPCDWDDDQTRNTLEWLKYQSAQGLDWKLNFCLIAITIGPEEYLKRVSASIHLLLLRDIFFANSAVCTTIEYVLQCT